MRWRYSPAAPTRPSSRARIGRPASASCFSPTASRSPGGERHDHDVERRHRPRPPARRRAASGWSRACRSSPLSSRSCRRLEVDAPRASRRARPAAPAGPSRPWLITITSSIVCCASKSMWLESRIVLPSAAKSRSSVRSQRMPWGSRPLTGSSSTSTAGSSSSAAARPSRWRMPSENVPTRRLAACSSPASASTSSTRGAGDRRRAWPAPAGGRARCGRDARRTARSRRPTRPCTRAWPALARASPTITFSAVVLPAPLGPRKPVIAPAAGGEREIVHRRGRAVALRESFDLDHAEHHRARSASRASAHGSELRLRP